MSDEQTLETTEVVEETKELSVDALEAEIDARMANPPDLEDDEVEAEVEPVVETPVKEEVAKETATPEETVPIETPAEKVEQKPDNDAFAKMRIAQKEAKEEAERLRVEIEELKSHKAEPSKPAPTERSATPEEALHAYRQAQSEGNDAGARAAVQWMNQYATAKEIAELGEKAQTGQFGEDSEEIERVLGVSYMVVQAKEQAVRDGERAESERLATTTQEAQKAYSAELVKVQADYADMINPETEVGKSAVSVKAMLDTSMSQAAKNHMIAHPLEYCQLVDSIIKSSSPVNTELAAKDKQISDLKAKLGIVDSPESGSAPAAETVEDESLEDLERKIERSIRNERAA